MLFFLKINATFCFEIYTTHLNNHSHEPTGAATYQYSQEAWWHYFSLAQLTSVFSTSNLWIFLLMILMKRYLKRRLDFLIMKWLPHNFISDLMKETSEYCFRIVNLKKDMNKLCVFYVYVQSLDFPDRDNLIYWKCSFRLITAFHCRVTVMRWREQQEECNNYKIYNVKYRQTYII